MKKDDIDENAAAAKIDADIKRKGISLYFPILSFRCRQGKLYARDNVAAWHCANRCLVSLDNTLCPLTIWQGKHAVESKQFRIPLAGLDAFKRMFWQVILPRVKPGVSFPDRDPIRVCGEEKVTTD